MIKRFKHIELFFEQKSFSQEDLNLLNQQIDKIAINDEDRKAQQTSVNMHLLAYSMGADLKKHEVDRTIKLTKPKINSERPRKKTSEKRIQELEQRIQNRKPSILNRPVDSKTEARREKLRSEMKPVKIERTKEYRGSKNTRVNIIYTRM
jgi:hypothetical protein